MRKSSMIPRETCPQCGSRRCKRNGHIHTGKQNHRCNVCGRDQRTGNGYAIHPDGIRQSRV